MWALDLGTTNTGLARWDAERARPALVELPAICRRPDSDDHLHAPRLIPSATRVLTEPSFARRLSRLPLLRRSLTLGRHAEIGRQALERGADGADPHFAPQFKGALARAPLRALARGPQGPCSAREVATMYLRELLGEVERQTGERIRELVVTVPVDSYERYRTEVSRILGRLGVRRVRFVDEPVAAAFGYGLGLSHQHLSLVVDFGAGTLDLALVRFGAAAASGQCDVIAKAGRPLGGNLVDRWLLSAFCAREGIRVPGLDAQDTPTTEPWLPLMLAEARRVKEALFFGPRAEFGLVPPDEEREFEARLSGAEYASELGVDRSLLDGVLRQRGLYEALQACLAEVEAAAHARSVSLDEVQDVLMVGGSTLLPGVFGVFEARFGRDRVRAWQPFEAVAYGGAALAADKVHGSDHIIHDYAIRTRNARTRDYEYSVVVPRGTRFPTDAPLWKRQLIPTCARGEPESYFKLVLCEMGRAFEGDRSFAWDERGQLHRLGGEDGEQLLVVPLNADNPTLGTLEPPHGPDDRRPRLEVSFGIDGERWLTATVHDLHARRTLLDGEAVIRLL